MIGYIVQDSGTIHIIHGAETLEDGRRYVEGRMAAGEWPVRYDTVELVQLAVERRQQAYRMGLRWERPTR